MGVLQILHTYFQDWEWGLPFNFSSHDSIDLCQQRRVSLHVVTAVIKSNFRQTLTALFGELQGTPLMFKQDILRRAHKIIERFERLPVRRESIERSDSVAAKIQSTLVRELIDVAGAQDDAAEVAHLREELSALISPDDNDMQDALTRSFVELARLASGVLQSLAISESDLAALGFTDQLVLPTAHRAMHAGFEKIAVKLLSKCVEPDCRLPDVLGRPTIHIAVETRCLQILRYLLEQNPKACHWRDSLQRTPLLIAASKGELAAFEILLEAGADIAARDLSNRTSLNYACSQGNVSIVEKLLAKGADVNDHTLNNLAALPQAATCGHYGVCTILLMSQQCVNQMGTAAKCAEANGHNRVVELIRGFINILNMKQYFFSCVQEQAWHTFQDEDGEGQSHLGEHIESNSSALLQRLDPDLLQCFDVPPGLSTVN